MRLSRNLFVLSAVVAAGLGVVGCGMRPPASGGGPGDPGAGPPPGSPEDAFARVRSALRAGDFGVIHDMLSEGAREKAEAEVERMASSAAAMGPLARELLGFDPADLGGLPAREKYVKVMKGAYETNARLESAFRSGKRESGLAGAEVAGAKADGDRATVTAKLPGGVTREVALVREDGAWKLAEPLSSRGEAPSEPAQDEAGAAKGSPEAAKEPPRPAERPAEP